MPELKSDVLDRKLERAADACAQASENLRVSAPIVIEDPDEVTEMLDVLRVRLDSLRDELGRWKNRRSTF